MTLTLYTPAWRARLARPCAGCAHPIGDHSPEGRCLTFEAPWTTAGPSCPCPQWSDHGRT